MAEDDMKKILRNSDLWPGTLTFGAMTLFCLIYLAIHLAAGEMGEAFAMGVVSALPASLTLLCAFTDRGDAKAVWVHPVVEEELLERAGVYEASCLNPANSDRAMRALDKDRPPDIG